MYYITTCDSPLGELTLASDGFALTGLWIKGQKYDRILLKGRETVKAEVPVFDKARSWLGRYFAGDRPEISELPLVMEGSDFQKRIWKLLCQIPYGETVTYGEISRKAAAQMGRSSMSAQAVGGAIGRNPISIIIPCHRVVGADGSLIGYAGGIDRKIMLLKHEGAI